jgi:hypothetical protein
LSIRRRFMPGMGFQSSLLEPSFTRGQETRNNLGEPVGANDFRLDRPMRVSGATDWVEAATFSGSGNARLNATGVAADGESGRMLVVDTGTAVLHVLTGSADSFTSIRTITRTTVGGQQHWPLPGITGYGVDETGGKAIHDLKNYEIAHGIMRITGEVRVKQSGGEWIAEGLAILYSLDDGETWAVASDDTDDPLQSGIIRGQRWSGHGYFTPYAREHTPLDIWFVDVSYMANVNPDDDERLFITRFTRADAESAWTFAGVMRMDWPLAGSFGGGKNHHLHCGGICGFEGAGGEKGLQVVVSVGDGINQRLDRIYITGSNDYDPGNPTAWDADWTDAGEWTLQPDYFGRGPDTANTHYNADQFTAIQQGANDREFVVGVDNDHGSFYHITMGLTATDPIQWRNNGPAVEHGLIFGMYASKSEQPHRLAHIRFNNLSANYATMYSPDWGETWTEVDRRDYPGIGIPGSIIGDWLYSTEVTGQLVSAKPIPSMALFTPIALGNGGSNGMHIEAQAGGTDGINAVSSEHKYWIIARHTDGFFYDFASTPGDENGNEAFRLPAIPSLTAHIYKFVTVASTGPNLVANIVVGPPLALGDHIRKVRTWLFSDQDDRAGFIGRMELRRNNAAVAASRRDNIAIKGDQWQALPTYYTFDLESGTVRHTFTLRTGVGNSATAGTFYFAIDQTGDGPFIGYPMPPRAASSDATAPIACDPEIYKLESVSFGDDAATLRIVGGMDRFCWADDDRAHHTDAVIATLKGDTSDYIELVLDNVNKRLVVRGEVDSSAITPINLGSGIRFPQEAAWDIVMTLDRGTLRVSAKLNGTIYSGTTSYGGETLDTLVFSNEAETLVSDQRLVGGYTLTTALDANGQADELNDLDTLLPFTEFDASNVCVALANDGGALRPAIRFDVAGDAVKLRTSYGEATAGSTRLDVLGLDSGGGLLPVPSGKSIVIPTTMTIGELLEEIAEVTSVQNIQLATGISLDDLAQSVLGDDSTAWESVDDVVGYAFSTVECVIGGGGAAILNLLVMDIL